MVEQFGQEMADAIQELAEQTSCTITSAPITVLAASYDYDNNKGTAQVTIPVNTIAIGTQLALVGLQPELDAQTELDLWQAAPYAHTLLVSFLNGDSKYMPHEEAYEMGTVESQKTGFAKGCAEKFVEVALDLLNQMKGTSASA